MKSVRIGGDLEHVIIALPDPDSGRDEQAADYDYYDANWVAARIEIAAGGFRGSYDAELFRDDFPDFRDALGKLYSFGSNEGEFDTIENQLHIEIRGDRRGNFEATVVARDSSDGNCLEFKLKFDQTYIPRMLAELDAIIAAYPVLGKPPAPRRNSSMSIEIRRATESDIPELSRLVAALAAWEQALDPRVQFDWDGLRDAPSWLRLVLNREHHAVWVAASEQRLVGHLWVRLKHQADGALPRSIGYISQAFMDENFRGRGLMKPMLEAAYEWFRDAGITVVTLSVLHRNWVGATAWHRLGFSDWREERRMDLKPRPK